MMAENFQNLEKEINLQIQEDQQTPNTINPKKLMPKHIVINLVKTKYQIKVLKATREKQHIINRRTRIPMTEFVIRNHGDQEESHTLLKVAESEELPPRSLYLSKIPSRN